MAEIVQLEPGPWTVMLSLLLDAGVKGIVLMALACLAVLVLRRSSAATRHLIWMLALIGLLVLPLVSLVAPQWQLPILPARAESVVPPVSLPTEALAPAAPAPVFEPREASPLPAAPPTPSYATPNEPAHPAPVITRAATTSTAPAQSLSPSALLLALWLAVATAALLPLLLGHLALLQKRRNARPITQTGLLALNNSLSRALHLRRPAKLLSAGRGAMPMAAGLLRPMVFLPEEAETWPEARQRTVLLHELAHVKRRDCLTHALARIAVSLHWFNPLAWYALRQLRIEREHACDDLVLAAGERPADYAEDLLQIARDFRASRLTGAAAITMAKPSHLEGRLLAVLDAARNRGLLSRKTVLLLGALATVILIPLSTVKLAESTSELAPYEHLYAKGIRIVLLGVGEHSDDPVRARWNPDGSPLSTAPKGFTDTTHLAQPYDNRVPKEFYFRVIDPRLERDRTEGLKFQIRGAVGSGGHQQSGQNLLVVASPPESEQSLDVEIGVYSGDWETVITGSLARKSIRGNHTLDIEEPQGEGSRRSVWITHNVTDRECRVVAIGPSGLERRVADLVPADQGETHRQEIPIGAIGKETLAIQRPFYEWQSFEDIALNPEGQGGNSAQHSAKYSSGIQARLIGVANTDGYDVLQVWKPSGAPLPGIPDGFVLKMGGRSSDKSGLLRRFYFEVEPVTEDTELGIKWNVEGNSVSHIVDRTPGRHFLQAQVFNVPDMSSGTNLELGIAAGPWESVHGTAGPHSSSENSEFAAAYSDFFEKEGSVRVVITHTPREDNYRLVVYDQSDSPFPTRQEASYGVGDMRQTEFVVEGDVSADQLEYMDLQARPYEWKRFTNVALHPKKNRKVPSASAQGKNTTNVAVWQTLVDQSLAEELNLPLEAIDAETTYRFAASVDGDELLGMLRANLRGQKKPVLGKSLTWLEDRNGSPTLFNDDSTIQLDTTVDGLLETREMRASAVANLQYDGATARLSMKLKLYALVGPNFAFGRDAPQSSTKPGLGDHDVAIDLNPGESAVFYAPLAGNHASDYCHFFVVQAVAAPAADAEYLRNFSDLRRWVAEGLEHVLVDAREAVAWATPPEAAPVSVKPPLVQPRVPEEQYATPVDTNPGFTIHAIGRPVEWPHRWWGLDGQPVAADPIWQEGYSGESTLAVVYSVNDSRDSITADLACHDCDDFDVGLLASGGGTRGEQRFPKKLALYGDELPAHLDAGGRVDFVAAMARGPWTDVATIRVGETVEAEGGTFRLDAAQARTRPATWGRQVPWLVELEGEFEFDPNWQIAIVAVDSEGNRSAEPENLGGVGIRTRRMSRTFPATILSDLNDVEQFIIMKRPYVNYTYENLPTSPVVPMDDAADATEALQSNLEISSDAHQPYRVQFRLVAPEGQHENATEVPWHEAACPKPDSPALWLLDRSYLNQDDIAKVQVLRGHVDTDYALAITLTEEGTDALAKVTEENVGKQLALVAGGKVVFAPRISAPIARGPIMLTGSLDAATANALALAIGGDAAELLSDDSPYAATLVEPSTKAREHDYGGYTAFAEGSEFDPLNRLFDGVRARQARLLERGIRIDFTRRVRTRSLTDEDSASANEYTGTLWMRDGNEFGEIRDARGRSARYYRVGEVVTTEHPNWSGIGGHLLLPPNTFDSEPQGRQIGYPVSKALPGELLSHQWRTPSDWTEEYVRARQKSGFLTAGAGGDCTDCIDTGQRGGVDYLSVNAGGMTLATSPPFGFALLQVWDTVASDFVQLDGEIWFPQKIVSEETITSDLQGGWHGYAEEIHVTDVTLAPEFPDGLFTPPEPDAGTLVIADYPSWRPDWAERDSLQRSTVQSAPDSEVSFAFGAGMTSDERSQFEVSMFWRNPARVEAALDAGAPLPFYDHREKEIVWARYDADDERLRREQPVLAPPAATPPETESTIAPDPGSPYLRTPPPDAVWGEPSNGLQAAIYFQPEQSAYAMGKAIDLEFLVRNVGNAPVEFASRVTRQDGVATIEDAAGNAVLSHRIMSTGMSSYQRIRLEPGETAGLREQAIGFGDYDTFDGHPGTIAPFAVAGVHRVRYTFRIDEPKPADGMELPPSHDWNGTLTTGFREIRLAKSVEDSHPAEQLEEILSGRTNRAVRLQNLGLKIAFKQQLESADGRIREFSGTYWMKANEETVELRDRRGHTARYYHDWNGPLIEGPRWDGVGDFDQFYDFFPPEGSTAEPAGTLRVYPDTTRIPNPAAALSHQWRRPVDWRHWYGADANTVRFAEKCGGAPGCIEIGALEGRETFDLGDETVAPALGYAVTQSPDMAAADFFEAAEGIWFPKSVSSTANAAGVRITYEITDIEVGPTVPMNFFRVPDPEENTSFALQVPRWSADWEQGNPVPVASLFGRAGGVALLEFSPDQREEALAVQKEFSRWFSDETSLFSTLNRFPVTLPFYDSEAQRVVYARYDPARERLATVPADQANTPKAVREILNGLPMDPQSDAIQLSRAARTRLLNTMPASAEALFALAQNNADHGTIGRRAAEVITHVWDDIPRGNREKFLSGLGENRVEARQKYPQGVPAMIGLGYAFPDCAHYWEGSDFLSVQTSSRWWVDGEAAGAPFEYNGPGARVGWIPLQDLPAGRHTVEVATSYTITCRGEQYEGTFHSGHIPFEIVPDIHPDDLAAPADEALDALIRETLQISDGEPAFDGIAERDFSIFWIEDDGTEVRLKMPVWDLAGTLPVDLCFEVSLQFEGTSDGFEGYPLVVINDRQENGYFSPRNTQAFAANRDGAVPLRIVLTPSRAHALTDKRVDQYYNGPPIRSGVVNAVITRTRPSVQ